MTSRTRDMRLNAANASPDQIAHAALDQDLGDLPQWNLSDLYMSPDAPELERDLEQALANAKSLKTTYAGKVTQVSADGAELAEAVRAYEALADLSGKIGSFAGLWHATDQSDPARLKFYADVSEKLTEIWTEVIFFELELNQIDEPVLAAALQHPDLSRYRPWFKDLRKEKPHQLEEKLEKLFTENRRRQPQRGTGCLTRP